ncbi:carbohydrate esterase family 4 protein [Flagelloscypha sp. PMI_526]|nr:carbohydrate esterase family 4 protein [Flagelloscypha sp. PMI_526]
MMSRAMKAAVLFVASAACSYALPHGRDHQDAGHVSTTLQGGNWYHPEDHPVYQLFRRDGPTDGATYPTIGSAQWSAGFPQNAPADVGKNIPQAWTDALNKAVAAGKIPNIPPSTTEAVKYSGGLDPNGKEVCSSTYGCRADGDIWDGPDGVYWTSFDDGPLEPTTALNAFLKQQNQTTTHFFIGSNILQNWKQFQESWELGHDMAVHTWSHRYTSSLSNTEILGELGWTMLIIHNSTGGRVPRYWRPPYGDADNRVRAIAKEVFGLTTVIWNHDTEDWTFMKGQIQPIVDNMKKFVALPKSPGLVVLQHELMSNTVAGFIQAYPSIAAAGWQFKSLALIGEANGTDPYQNSAGPSSPVIPADVWLGSKSNVTTTSAGAAATAGNSSSTTASTNAKGNWARPTRTSTNTGAFVGMLTLLVMGFML